MSLYAYISTRRIKQNVMIERLLAPTPPPQLPEVVTEPPEVRIRIRCYYLQILVLVNSILIS